MTVIEARSVRLAEVQFSHGAVSPTRPARFAADRPGADLSVDASGLFALVGLRDDHVHLNSVADLDAFLRCGVTAVTDMAGTPWHRRLRTELSVAGRGWPQVRQASPPLDGPGLRTTTIAGHGVIVSDQDDVSTLVRTLVQRRYDFVKTYDDIGIDELRAISRSCQEFSTPFGGHCPRWASWEEYSATGASRIEHMVGIWRSSAALRDRVGSELNPADVRRHLSDDDIRALAAVLVRSGTRLCPTLVVTSSIERRKVLCGPVSDMRPDLVDMWNAASEGESPAEAATKDEYLEFLVHAVGLLHRCGVRITAGSDTPDPFLPPGRSLFFELGLLAEAFGSGAAALEAAINSSAVDQLYSDGERSAAGFTLYGEDPRDDLGTLSRPVAVWTGGVLNILDDAFVERIAGRPDGFLPQPQSFVRAGSPLVAPFPTKAAILDGRYCTLQVSVLITGDQIELVETLEGDGRTPRTPIVRRVVFDLTQRRLCYGIAETDGWRVELIVNGGEIACYRYSNGALDAYESMAIPPDAVVLPGLALSACLPWTLASVGFLCEGTRYLAVAPGDWDREFSGLERGAIALLKTVDEFQHAEYKQSCTSGVLTIKTTGRAGAPTPARMLEPSTGWLEERVTP